MNLPRIPDDEFHSRQIRTQALVAEAGLDALVVHSNEADFANVRYLSDFWPLFECAGVLVPAQGRLALLVGPESEIFAASRTKIPLVRKMVAYREPAEPDYPGVPVATFQSVMAETLGREPRRIGVAGWAIFPQPVMDELRAEFPSAEIVKADDIIFRQRAIKSENEVACLRAAFAIAEKAVTAAVERMRPGQTELEIAGIAQEIIYREGAEYEGLPQYVLSGAATSHAIGRASYRQFTDPDIVQLNLSARVHGYSPSPGRPVIIGKLSDAARELLEFGLEAHHYTKSLLVPGKAASAVAADYEAFVTAKGFREYMLYGPCHGLGMIEVERPWIESSSTYELQPCMTFQIDTFFYAPAGSELARRHGSPFGLRWENGCLVTAGGPSLLGTEPRELVFAGK